MIIIKRFSFATALLALLVTVTLSACSTQKSAPAQTLPNAKNVLQTLNKVNDYWQSENPEPGWAFWEHAAYHTGNMEAYYVTGNKRYLDYSTRWAEKNQLQGAKSSDRANWKYSYGEKDDFVLFGDWQICFQTYIDLYTISGDRKKNCARS